MSRVQYVSQAASSCAAVWAITGCSRLDILPFVVFQLALLAICLVTMVCDTEHVLPFLASAKHACNVEEACQCHQHGCGPENPVTSSLHATTQPRWIITTCITVKKRQSCVRCVFTVAVGASYLAVHAPGLGRLSDSCLILL